MLMILSIWRPLLLWMFRQCENDSYLIGVLPSLALESASFLTSAIFSFCHVFLCVARLFENSYESVLLFMADIFIHFTLKQRIILVVTS